MWWCNAIIGPFLKEGREVEGLSIDAKFVLLKLLFICLWDVDGLLYDNPARSGAGTK